MPPSPERIEGPQPNSEQDPAKGAQSRLPRGLQLNARVTSHTWEVGLSAAMQDFTPGEVILLIDDPITAGTHVSVEVNACAFSGEILYCEQNGARWEAHVSFDDVDETGLRRTPRFPVSIPARVFSAASEVPIDGRVVDVSGEGLGLEVAEPLPKQTNIAVQTEENTALGVVRHCRELNSGIYRIGIQLLHILKKDPDLVAEESGWMKKLGARFGLKKPDRPKGWS